MSAPANAAARRGLFLVWLVAGAFALASSTAFAAPRHVYVQGGGGCSDQRSAAQAARPRTPLCSIDRAVRVVPAGGAVLVRRGTYPRFSVTRRFARRVTIRPRGHENVVLANGFHVQDASHVRIQGFAVRSTGEMSDVFTSDHVAIRGNDFSPAGMIVRAVRDSTIAHNRIHDLRRPPGPPGFEGYGLWVNGYWNGGAQDGLSRLTIEGNVFRNIPQDAIQVGGGNDRVADITIARNAFHDIRRANPVDHPDPIQIIGARGAVIRGNVFTGSEDAIIVKDDTTYGLRVENNVMIGWRGGCIQAQFWNTPGAVVQNNTIWNSACLGLRFAAEPGMGSMPTGIVVRNNIVDRFAAGDERWLAVEDHNLFADGTGSGRHDLSSRPRFARGWRLAARSPGIDAGDSTGAPKRDRTGHRRVDDPRVRNRGSGRVRFGDLGAYERRRP